jgi:PKD repeat protein
MARLPIHRVRSIAVLGALAVALLAASTLPTAYAGIAPATGRLAAEHPALVNPPSTAVRSAIGSPALHIILPHPTWINVTNDSSGAAPPAVQGGSAAYDPTDHETVYFGGVNPSYDLTNQTWVFANGTWTNETDPFFAPPARAFAAMDFDANMNGALLFGGEGDLGDLNDTWLFQGGVWTNLTADYGTAPPPTYGAVMAFDPDEPENGSVLFGGYSPYSSTGYLNTTWIWQGGAGWVPLTTNSIAPPELFAPSMAYDATDGYILLFGGVTPSLADSAQTWELYAGQWWAVSPATSPPARSYSSMVDVPDLPGVLLFGGYSFETGLDLGDTWLFSGGAWTQLGPAASPPEMSTFAVALDGTGTAPLVIGGANDSYDFDYNATWAYEFVPYTFFTANVSSSEVGESVAFTATPGDGTSPYRAVFDFGDGTYATASGPGPLTVDHVYTENTTMEASVVITDAVGASASEGPIAISVATPPRVAVQVAASSGDAGYGFAFTSTVLSPGAGSLTYNWSFGDGSYAASADAMHAYSTTGTFDVILNATDADHSTATAALTVTVNPDPTLAVAATSTHPAVEASATFFANVTGGTGPFSYVWLFGDGSAASDFPAPQHAFRATGTYTVQVWVNDSSGTSTHQTLAVSVGSGAGSASSGGSAPWWFWAGIGVLAAAVIGGSALLIGRSRKA